MQKSLVLHRRKRNPTHEGRLGPYRVSNAQDEECLGTTRDATQAVVLLTRNQASFLKNCLTRNNLPSKSELPDNSDPVWHHKVKGLQPAGKKLQVWESVGLPDVERNKDFGKAESPNKSVIFVSMALVVVSSTDIHEETAYR